MVVRDRGGWKPLRVRVDGVEVDANDPAGGWEYANGVVALTGGLCARVTEATAREPVVIEIEVPVTR